MAKVINPAFSLDARGHIRKTFVYSKTLSCNVVKAYKKSPDAKTISQQNARGVYAQGCGVWSAMTEPQKQVYRDRVGNRALIGFNIFLSEYIKQNQYPVNTSMLGVAIIGFIELNA